MEVVRYLSEITTLPEPELKVEDHFPWWLTSFYVVPLVLIPYFLWVCKYGPRMMRDRKPYELKGIIMVYNIIQILMNGYMVYIAFEKWGWGPFQAWNHVCHPVSGTIGNTYDNKYTSMALGTYYYLTKIVDLLDTVFFVLRKKQNQITFLHIFHHSSMVFCMWMGLVHLREEIGGLFALINMIIHVIMYSYYFLSTMGPKVQKYLWWKKYLTRLQMIQFILIISILVKMRVVNCPVHPLFWAMWFGEISIFLAFFTNFYIKSYMKKQE